MKAETLLTAGSVMLEPYAAVRSINDTLAGIQECRQHWSFQTTADA